LILTLDKTDISCFGASDGTVDLSVNGGTIPYTYFWDSGHISEDLSSIPAAAYCVTVTDANSCTFTDCVTINEPDLLTYTTSTVPISCYNVLDGNITINVNGGMIPYSYLWYKWSYC